MTVSCLARTSDTDLPSVDPATYRSVLGRFATGVTVMTARGPDGRMVGVTASSFNTVSLDPPLILWSLALSAPSLEVFRQQDYFAVNVLSAAQRDLAMHFARARDDKFHGIETVDAECGAALLTDATAHIECRVEHRYPGGDHEIIVGRVLSLSASEHAPLLFHRGRFAELVEII